jgi:hypothetical protein
MTARAQIEKLTNTWYGYHAFMALVSLVLGFTTSVSSGVSSLFDLSLLGAVAHGVFGIFSAVMTVGWLVVMLAVTAFFGNRLLKKSYFWRLVLLAISGVFMFFGVLGVLAGAWSFLGSWSLVKLAAVAASALNVYMLWTSWQTLTSSEVKSYFA